MYQAMICAVALALLALLQPAAAADPGEAFLHLKGGRTTWSFDDFFGDSESSSTYGAQAGYRWHINADNSLGPEIGYIDFGKVDDGIGGFASLKLKGTAVTVGLNYQLTFGSGSFFLDARAGYMHWRGHASSQISLGSLGSYSASGDGSGDGEYAGAGVGYYLTRNFGLSMNYDFHTTTIDHQRVRLGSFTVGADFRF